MNTGRRGSSSYQGSRVKNRSGGSARAVPAMARSSAKAETPPEPEKLQKPEKTKTRQTARAAEPAETPQKPAEAPELRAPEQPKTTVRNERIEKWLKQVHFKKTAIGGVSEADVWKKLGELNDLYEAALAAERLRYDALLEERVKAASRKLAREMLLRQKNERGRAGDGF